MVEEECAIRFLDTTSGAQIRVIGHQPAYYLDITRLREDTGFRPERDVKRAVPDYIDWLRRSCRRHVAAGLRRVQSPKGDRANRRPQPIT